MMKTIALYPGTFDPVTHGHRDIIRRAAKLFDTLIVAVASNDNKKPFFTLSERIKLLEDVTTEFKNVQVTGFHSLLVDFAKEQNASVIVRGLRAATDFEFECQLASMNRQLAPNIETVFLTAADNHTYLSSTLVKEVAFLGGDVSPFVTPVVVKALKEK